MTPLESLMRTWLASGTEAQQAHAAHRLTLPFEDDPEPPPPAWGTVTTTAMPGLLARAAHFAVAVTHHIATGMPTLAEPEYQARLAVCGPCDQRLSWGVCAGCFCNIAVKARWADQDCPLGKWAKVDA